MGLFKKIGGAIKGVAQKAVSGMTGTGRFIASGGKDFKLFNDKSIKDNFRQNIRGQEKARRFVNGKQEEGGFNLEGYGKDLANRKLSDRLNLDISRFPKSKEELGLFGERFISRLPSSMDDTTGSGKKLKEMGRKLLGRATRSSKGNTSLSPVYNKQKDVGNIARRKVGKKAKSTAMQKSEVTTNTVVKNAVIGAGVAFLIKKLFKI